MKTRTRKSPVKISSEENNTPFILGLFLVMIIYLVFGNAIANISLILYLIGLFCIAPLFVIAWNLIKKLLIVSYSLNTIKFIAIFVWINLLILFFVSRWSGFMYILGLYSFLIAFIAYIPYLESKHTQKLSRLKSESQHRGLFKIHLEDKNFLNHHNYFVSPKNKEIYLKVTKQNRLLGIFFSAIVIPFMILAGGLSEMSAGGISWKDVLGIYIMLFCIVCIIRGMKYVYEVVSKNDYKQIKGIYQATMVNKKFLKYRNKIFFY